MFSKNSYLMCRPTYFDVDYEINPWMHLDNKPNRELAEKQWLKLVEQLNGIGADLHFLDQVNGLPDMVFTANGGSIIGNKAVAPLMQFPERSGEEKQFIDWFEQHNFEVYVPKKGSFEGEGDMFLVGDTLFCGYGFRSSKDTYLEIADFFGIKKVIYCELTDPSFYHLDTCFLPLTDDLVMLHETAFTSESIKAIRSKVKTITAPAEDAKHFACNSVKVNKEIVIPADCKMTEALLNGEGFSTHAVELTEYIKAGGAAKCLTLRLGTTSKG